MRPVEESGGAPSTLRLTDLRGRRIAVLGAGREGLSAARLIANRLQTRATVLGESEPSASLGEALAQLPGIAVRIAPDAFADLSGYDVAIRSPGLPVRRPELARARAAGLVFSSLTDLFLAEHAEDPVVAVTGTKGKSTTASLIGLALEASGWPAVVAGNIGTPVFDADPEGRARVHVVEVSSYQACDLQSGPSIAVLTSLYPEHLDWHGGREAYYVDKLNLLRRATGHVVVDATCAEARRRTEGLRSRRFFGDPGGIHEAGGEIRDGERSLGRLDELPLRGAHDISNACAALTVAALLGCDLQAAWQGIARYPGLPHRLRQIAVRRGVRFVDDALSTIPQSTLHAIRAYEDGPIALILGGRDRGVDPAPLLDRLVGGGVVRVALMGEMGTVLR
ncbi:MAG: UDP-N-acetylmuramoyl-L-alanine--D-glutamate ligase, partial [Myxococcales bacterium]|nr:UDP-N-acetylmuramoyl-L-alanine--D-glutamate ligase [Myxococcales bacterium]